MNVCITGILAGLLVSYTYTHERKSKRDEHLAGRPIDDTVIGISEQACVPNKNFSFEQLPQNGYGDVMNDG
jgi:hypothetical protein